MNTEKNPAKTCTSLTRNTVYRWCVGNWCVEFVYSHELPKKETLEIVISYQQVFFSCVFGYWNTRVSTNKGRFCAYTKETKKNEWQQQHKKNNDQKCANVLYMYIHNIVAYICASFYSLEIHFEPGRFFNSSLGRDDVPWNEQKNIYMQMKKKGTKQYIKHQAMQP